MAESLFRDTIYAISSGRLPAGIAVVRISGPHAAKALEAIAGALPNPRHARFAVVRNGRGEELDRALKLFFPGPNSETGEDIAELHLHGGRALVASVLGELSQMEGLRHAEAGEFTRRALLNGKIDLLGVEALGDLVAAETEGQRRFAQANSGTPQAALYSGWRDRLVRARALIEAELDFADEADVPGSVSDQVWIDMQSLAADIERHIAGYHRAEMVRDGYQVVIVGPPNAGKSSLLNALARRDVAIVSDEPGTTRDLVEVSLDLGGAKVVVTDTAGIRDDAGKVEGIGIARAMAKADAADLVLKVTAADALTTHMALGESVAFLAVLTKSDLRSQPGFDVEVSSATGAGIDRLLGMIEAHAKGAMGGSNIAPSRERHVQFLTTSRNALKEALNDRHPLELRAEELRSASDALGRITGAVDVEDLLDVVFSQFCIGK